MQHEYKVLAILFETIIKKEDGGKFFEHKQIIELNECEEIEPVSSTKTMIYLTSWAVGTTLRLIGGV